MKIHFVKNVQFTKMVKANGKLKEFNFRKLKKNDQQLFTVDVSDDRGNRIIFTMETVDGKWTILEDNLPDWITENEDRLNELIKEEGEG